ncbi:class I SAM-dependent methyltransferase [Ruegeria arenilitoris]|uniref:class I SAM-dependent methyltransferase n=1 Tax=Ruegeria arenilitoris TaxID=1173585 RepID=UPI001480AA09|nr:class I SAM-dependent methyltransferase [Ruegeria arenilitoris]
MTMWTDEHQSQIRSKLLGEGSGDLIRYMLQKNMKVEIDGISAGAIQSAVELGWIDETTQEITPAGSMVADSCREYSFWLERDKVLPFEGAAPHLTASYFEDRIVMEVGPGMGANLMSLAKAGSQVLGVEPIEAYAKMGRIFAEREGLRSPDIQYGRAEALPFPDSKLDIVLFVTSHQYFDIHRALTEIFRVLRPGGELIIVGATLWSYCSNNIGFVTDSFGLARAYALTVINTGSYTFFGKRIVPARHGNVSTSRPIYPSRAAMRRWLTGAGLIECSPDCKVGAETCFHYIKP